MKLFKAFCLALVWGLVLPPLISSKDWLFFTAGGALFIATAYATYVFIRSIIDEKS